MVFINHSTQQMAAKVVYYGPGLCGKTTNLQWIFDNTTPDTRGEMVSMATETDRTLFFDLLPIELGRIGDFDVRIQLYTVPGQVFYNSTRKLVLRGVDGIVFVADSQRDMVQSNIESLANLEENLAEMDLTLDSVPLVLQYNKRDLPNPLTVDELNKALNRSGWPTVESVAVDGVGVIETLKVISKATLRHLRSAMGGTASAKKKVAAKPAAKPPRPLPSRPLPKPPVPSTQSMKAVPVDMEPVEVPPPTQVLPPDMPPPPAAPPPALPPPVAPPPAAPPPVTPDDVLAEIEPLPLEPELPEPEPPAAPARPVLRFAEALIHQRLVVGKPCLLRIAVKRQAPGKDFAALQPAAAPNVSAQVDVVVTPQDFNIADSASPHCHHQTVTLAGDGDPEPILFKLHPRLVGRKRVKVDLLQDGRYAGGVSIEADVVAVAEAETPPVAAAYGVLSLEAAATPPDLTVLVTEKRRNEYCRSYRFTLHSPRNGLTYYSPRQELLLYGQPDQWLAGIHEELAALGPMTDPTQVAETLNAVSSDLYEKLFTRELKKIWRERVRGKVSSISLVSDETWIPWEMVRPHCLDDSGSWVEDDFLCADYRFGRWLAGTTPTAGLEVTKGALVASRDAQESPAIAGLSEISTIEPALMAVEHMVPHGGFDLIHFSGDGVFEDDGSWSLRLDGDDRLKPSGLTSARPSFESERPLVVLNARGKGDTFARVGLAGWASALLPATVGGFLGNVWEVDEALAARFARAFYGTLHQGRTLGEAMQAARTELRALPTSTWLAYVLFGDPMASVRFSK